MRRRKLTPRSAVWSGLLATPVLVIGLVMLIGVTTGAAGPTKTAATDASATANQVAGGPVSQVTALGSGQQTLAELRAYWTPERMASAQPYPLKSPAAADRATGSVESVPQTTGMGHLATIRPDGTVEVTDVPRADSAGALTEPFHGAIPFTRWQWFGRYLRNVPAGSPNAGISAVHKMFFTQGASNFVCSSSSSSADGVWTAGHCVHQGSGGAAGYSTNVLFCPSYDSTQGGVNPTAGCWGAEELWTWCPQWCDSGDFDFDFGGADASDNPVVGPQTGQIGTYTGTYGFAWNFGNEHWISLGYPAGAPFNGGTIMVCASSLGYTDSGGPGTPDSRAMGCDMTGGSSGGPWVLQFGRPGQPGGLGGRFLNGHNDWRHTAVPNEMASPYFDVRACLMWEAINDLDLPC